MAQQDRQIGKIDYDTPIMAPLFPTGVAQRVSFEDIVKDNVDSFTPQRLNGKDHSEPAVRTFSIGVGEAVEIPVSGLRALDGKSVRQTLFLRGTRERKLTKDARKKLEERRRQKGDDVQSKYRAASRSGPELFVEMDLSAFVEEKQGDKHISEPWVSKRDDPEQPVRLEQRFSLPDPVEQYKSMIADVTDPEIVDILAEEQAQGQVGGPEPTPIETLSFGPPRVYYPILVDDLGPDSRP